MKYYHKEISPKTCLRKADYVTYSLDITLHYIKLKSK